MKQKLTNALNDLLEYKYGIIFIFTINLICYFYLFSEHIFTNHTIPEIFFTPMPSNVTFYYGRWMSDFITTLFGGVGIQPVSMFISTIVIIVNAFLLIKIFKINNWKWFIITGLILTLAPERFDIVTFSSVMHVHAIADLFVLVGAYFLLNYQSVLQKIVIPTIMFLFAIACTQIKLPLILLMIAVGLLLKWIYFDKKESLTTRNLLIDVGIAILTVILSSGIYYITYKSLTIPKSANFLRHDYRNGIKEMAFQIIGSYKNFYCYYTNANSYLPRFLSVIPLIIICISIGSLTHKFFKKNWLIVIFSTLILLSLPVILNSVYIIDSQSGQGGRFLMHYSYFLLICILFTAKYIKLLPTIKELWSKRVLVLMAVILIYFTAILSLQRTNYYFHKGKQEELVIQRVLSRIESKVPNLYSQHYNLIVFGYPTIQNSDQFIMKNTQNAPKAHFSSHFFEIYRQPQILNYFLGNYTFVYPNKSDYELIMPLVESMEPWPSENSIIVKDNVVVITFEKFHKDIEQTWTEER
jgi:hypothetical protein